MASNNVLSMQAVRELKEIQQQEDHAYRARVLGMDKLELLEEMIRFQEERSRTGHLTVKMMVQGKILFKELEGAAETRELKILTRSYRRHLEHELAEYLRTGKLQTVL